jgi:hypothetical protein
MICFGCLAIKPNGKSNMPTKKTEVEMLLAIIASIKKYPYIPRTLFEKIEEMEKEYAATHR